MPEPEVEVTSPAVEQEEIDYAALPKVSLNILQDIRAVQQQNGLLHDDYTRYRQYCSRRIRRLRTGKQIKLTQGRGRRFDNIKVTVDVVEEPRHLLLVLAQAERAWAYAMQLKQDFDEHPSAKLRNHMIRRLRKAASWASNLNELSNVRGDSRTQLEANAYWGWIQGQLCVELKHWQEGLKAFQTASDIYSQLANVASARERLQFMERASELMPLVRFCKFHLERSGGAGQASEAELVDLRSDGQGLAVLQSNIDNLLAEAAKEKTADLSELVWAGIQLPLQDDKLKELYGRTQQSSLQSGSRETSYLDALSRFDDCIRAAANEGGRLARSTRTTDAQDMLLFELSLRSQKAQLMFWHVMKLADAQAKRLFDAPVLSAKPANAASQASSMYSRAIRVLSELKVQLETTSGGLTQRTATEDTALRQIADVIDGGIDTVNACKARCVARSFLPDQVKQAAGLVEYAGQVRNRAAQLVEGAAHHVAVDVLGKDVFATLDHLSAAIARDEVLIRATAAAGSSLSTDSSAGSLEVGVKPQLVELPMKLQAVPTKPFHLDLAHQFIVPPKLKISAKATQKQQAAAAKSKAGTGEEAAGGGGGGGWLGWLRR